MEESIFDKIIDIKDWIFPEKCKFILANSKKDRILVVQKNAIYYTGYQSLFSFKGATSYFNLKRERGRILSGFCGIENIISELFVITLGGFTDSNKQVMIRNTTKQLTLSEQINILRESGVIPKNLKAILWPLIEFRNQIAHEFVLRELKYGDNIVIDDNLANSIKLSKKNIKSFENIENDFFAAWHHLILTYSQNQKSVLEWINKLLVMYEARK